MDYDKAWFLLIRVRWFSLDMHWLSSFGLSPTFILQIWHVGEWLKRYLAQPIYGRVEHRSPISGRFIALINEKFIPLIFMCKCTGVYMDFDG